VPDRTLSALIFVLVTCAFATIYITQPVLPILEAQFAIGPSAASLSVSAVIVGMAVTTLPIGVLVDRFAATRLMITGACVIAAAGAVCAATTSFPVLIAMRALQGAFVPTLTTSVAAWLSRTLPARALNVAMGTYVSATVAGGLGGRLLAGWAFPPAHWRYAFVTVGATLLVVTLLVAPRLTEPARTGGVPVSPTPLIRLVGRRAQVLAQLAAFGAFGAFSTAFNYFPFHLSRPPWSLATPTITALYLVYVAGLFMGPFAGRLGNRFGNGVVMIGGAIVLASALSLSLVVNVAALIASLIGLCVGFFAIHAAAVGALNRSLSGERGRANALYTLFYYLGGAAGIGAGGVLYARFGWRGIVGVSVTLTLLPLAVGAIQWRSARASR
jgi:MFS transporter, YNFM family, putative membrane transport protein